MGPNGSRVWDPCGPGPAKICGCAGPKVISPTLNDNIIHKLTIEKPDEKSYFVAPNMQDWWQYKSNSNFYIFCISQKGYKVAKMGLMFERLWIWNPKKG